MGRIGHRAASLLVASLLAVAGLAGPQLVVQASGTADMRVGISSPSTVQWGQNFTYGVFIYNGGPDTATGVVLTVQLPPEVGYRGSNSSSCAATGQTVTCSFAYWGVNAAGGLSLFAQAMATGTAVAQATLSANESDPTPSDNTASVTTTITPSTTADLSVGISENPNPAYAGGTLRYNVTDVNEGPGNATHTTLIDPLPAGLTFVASESDARCSVDSSNVVTCSLGTTWVRAVDEVSIAARSQAAGSYTNTVSLSSDQTDPTPSDNSASVTTQVLPSADLSVTNLASPNPVTAGHKVTFTLTVTNHGPSPATGLSLADSWTATSEIKGGIAFISVSSSQGSCSQSGSSVSCSLGNLAAGAAATVTVVIQPRSKGTLSDTVTAAANEHDPSPGDNSATSAVTVS
jgi:uncharacterized repeat protein (TIGR01451 family)